MAATRPRPPDPSLPGSSCPGRRACQPGHPCSSQLPPSFGARGLPLPAPNLEGLGWELPTIAALLVAGAAVAVFTGSRMTAIAGLGVTGIAMSLIFLVFSAPDVAITQLLVETLVVVMVALAMLRLPELGHLGFHAGRAVIALALGGAVTLILLGVLSQPFDPRLTAYFNAASYPEAHGRNIVNVILVDFRAIDTFGEIAVVTIAALSAFALLRAGRTGKGEDR
ncbi:hydrogen gas-evolving membrane-bound hydrogenase subunit E [Mangrovicoccus ximenensis]|uniref:hydrogen gas-evolving membrane-bound hydrogenase subunit E n=1 Tax=Mangrovicoccus ximenensis TaxID=1911570 RepID=UPI001F3E4A31|nr:hydrogen gas-evolving membrane-bound hydrogenase subunit E [Mangrovicoccus ximenensis]